MVNKHRKFYFLPTLSATLRWNLLFSCWPDENFIVTQDPDEIHKIPLCTSFCLRHIFSTRKRSLWSQPLNISSIPLLQSSLISEPTSRLMPWTTTDFLLMLLILHEHFTPLGANFGCWGDLIDIVLFRYISPPQSENLKKNNWKNIMWSANELLKGKSFGFRILCLELTDVMSHCSKYCMSKKLQVPYFPTDRTHFLIEIWVGPKSGLQLIGGYKHFDMSLICTRSLWCTLNWCFNVCNELFLTHNTRN